MALSIEKRFSVDLDKPLNVQYGGGLMFTGDAGADTFEITLYKSGEAYAPGGSVALNCIRADGNTVTVTGSISGNVASATLTQACCAIPGPLSVVMQIISGGNTGAVFAAAYTVMPAQTGDPIDPGTMITDIDALIAQIDAAVDSIPADYSDLLAAIAPTFSTSTAYAEGDYVWYDGDLYKFTIAHSAGAWTGSDAAAAVFATDIADLKSAIGDLDDLETTDKSNLVAAINEAASGASVAGDVAELQAAVFHEAGTSMANTTYSGLATANNMWGFNLPGVTAGKIVVKPKFNTESGTYTAKRWRPTQGSLVTNTLVEEVEAKTANIGESVYFDDVTPDDFFSFLSANTADRLYYCNNNAQTYNVPLGNVFIVSGTANYKYTVQPLYFAALQLDIIENESNFVLKLDKDQGAENVGKLLMVGEDGEVTPVDTEIPTVDSTLRIEGEAAESKTVGDILLDQPIGPALVWTKGKFFNATTGEITTNTNAAITEDFLAVDELRTLYLTIDYPETPGYLLTYWQILTYQSDGSYVGYEQFSFSVTNQVRVLKPGYKYRFAMNYTNAGGFTFDEILGMIAYHWKEPLPDQIGLVTKVGTLEDGIALVDQLNTEVNGGGEKINFFIEKGSIDATTGADSASNAYGRSIGYYESDGDPIIISVPVGGRCLVYEYSGESSNDFIRTISPATTDGITYVSSPYTLVTTSGYFYRFTFVLNNDSTWQDGQEFFKDFTFVLQSTAVEGLEKRVTALEQASGSDKIFTGKTCVALGDSITYRNVWQPVVSDALGMTMINKGIGSTCLGGANDSTAMCSTTRLNGVLAESPDYVTILGGANDLTTNMAIGTEAEFSKALAQKDRDTFVGAYSYIVEYLLGQDPTLSIMILGTTWAHNDGTRYSETKTYTDYSDASRMVAQYYGLPFVDLHGECGFNAFTMGSASANQIYSSDQIHPNTEGGKRIASLVIAKMIEAWKYTV